MEFKRRLGNKNFFDKIVRMYILYEKHYNSPKFYKVNFFKFLSKSLFLKNKGFWSRRSILTEELIREFFPIEKMEPGNYYMQVLEPQQDVLSESFLKEIMEKFNYAKITNEVNYILKERQYYRENPVF